MISPPQSAASNDGAREEQPNTLSTVSRAIFLVSLPFGILRFVLPIFGRQVGTGAGGWLCESAGPQAPFVANGLILGACALVLAALLREPNRLATATPV